MGGTIILPPLYKEESVRHAIASPIVMIASDGMFLSGERAHPRTFGTFFQGSRPLRSRGTGR